MQTFMYAPSRHPCSGAARLCRSPSREPGILVRGMPVRDSDYHGSPRSASAIFERRADDALRGPTIGHLACRGGKRRLQLFFRNASRLTTSAPGAGAGSFFSGSALRAAFVDGAFSASAFARFSVPAATFGTELLRAAGNADGFGGSSAG